MNRIELLHQIIDAWKDVNAISNSIIQELQNTNVLKSKRNKRINSLLRRRDDLDETINELQKQLELI